jgi:hypothetical protein
MQVSKSRQTPCTLGFMHPLPSSVSGVQPEEEKVETLPHTQITTVLTHWAFPPLKNTSGLLDLNLYNDLEFRIYVAPEDQ